jgi:hypothetical protein
MEACLFILYALVIGLAVGLLSRGRPDQLGAIVIRWPWVIVGGLIAQVVLFSDPVTRVVGDLGPPLYVLTTALVLVAVAASRRVPGIPLVVAGALANLIAIAANGGYMPTTAAALASLGKSAPVVYSNSSVPAQATLWPLTDIFAMPSWLPFANVFSIGDLLIGLGVVVAIVATMHRTSPVGPRSADRVPAADPR